jgi:hypothetical protein
MKGRPRPLTASETKALRGFVRAISDKDDEREVVFALFCRFKEMCRRNRVHVSRRILPSVLAQLYRESIDNRDGLRASLTDVTSVTVYHGTIHRKLREGFPEFADSPSIYTRAAVQMPVSPLKLLRRLKIRKARLLARPEFAEFRKVPGIVTHAILYHPDRETWFLRRVQTEFAKLEQDQEFQIFRHQRHILLRAVVQHPNDPRAFLRVVKERMWDLAEGTDFTESPATFARVAAYYAASATGGRKQRHGEELATTEDAAPAWREPTKATEADAAQSADSQSADRSDRLKSAFLDAAGVVDHAPYGGLSTRETIDAIRRAASIPSAAIVRPSETEAPDFDAGRLISDAAIFGAAAVRLGSTVRPFLQRAIAEQRIAAGNCLPTTRVRKEEERLVLQFYEACVIHPSEPLMYLRLPEILHGFYLMLHQNLGLTGSQIGARFTPSMKGELLLKRLLGVLDIDPIFIAQFADAIDPELKRGVDAGWLDPRSKTPYPLQLILAKRLGKPIAFLRETTGLNALRHCIGKAGLPQSAIGPLIGKSDSWLRRILQRDAAIQLYAAHAVLIADAIRPYLEGIKHWKRVGPTTRKNDRR